MKRYLLIATLTCLVALIGAGCGHLGARRSPHTVIEEAAFQRGMEVGNGRFSWLHAAENWMYFQLYELDRKDQLPAHFELNMWLSIIELDKFIRNPDVDKPEREAGARMLKKLVTHFNKHPREKTLPSETNLSSGVDQKLKQRLNDDSLDIQDKQLLEEIGEGLKETLTQLENVFDSMLADFHDRDLATRAVFERLNKAGFDDRVEHRCDGITIIVPRESYSSGSDDNSIRYEGESVKFSLVDKRVTINGRDYGSLAFGDIVDLRHEGKVFVNQLERAPVEQSAPADAEKPRR